MMIEKKEIKAKGIRFCLRHDGKEMGRAFLYILKNNLHDKPFGFLEDVFVEEPFRGQGIGAKLVKAVIEEAKKQGCYKLICTSRHAKKEVHEFYQKLGFYDQGLEFRMNFQ